MTASIRHVDVYGEDIELGADGDPKIPLVCKPCWDTYIKPHVPERPYALRLEPMLKLVAEARDRYVADGCPPRPPIYHRHNRPEPDPVKARRGRSKSVLPRESGRRVLQRRGAVESPPTEEAAPATRTSTPELDGLDMLSSVSSGPGAVAYEAEGAYVGYVEAGLVGLAHRVADEKAVRPGASPRRRSA